jgi:RNA polymerase sigma factor (sigma-70 family)
MNIRPRQEIIELFSTFLQFEADHFSGWATDYRLRRNMQRRLEDYSRRKPVLIATGQSLEQFWALYWHHCWQAQVNTLAEGHLAAYLQEPCYWAAQRLVRQFTNTQFGVSDYCQIAMAEMRTILKGFKPDRNASLKTFASVAFPNLLKDQLRQRQEANLCSSLGLLRRISKKRLLEALRQSGLSAAAIAHYQLAWMCFNALYVQTQTGTKQLPPVDRSLWLAIANLYNTQRHQQPVPAGTDCTPEMMEQWLNQCATWVRAYLYPVVESLNVPKVGLEAVGERQDDLTEPLQESLLTAWISQDDDQARQEQQSQIRRAIVTALEQLNDQSQELLRLYYQQELTQQEMMQQLQMSQATVSRRLTKAREALLLALIEWSQQTLNNAPTPNLIKDMSAALEEWLGVHYGVPNPSLSRQTADQGTE